MYAKGMFHCLEARENSPGWEPRRGMGVWRCSHSDQRDFFQEDVIIRKGREPGTHNVGLWDSELTVSGPALGTLCRTHHCSFLLSQEPGGRDLTVTRKETLGLHQRDSKVLGMGIG